MKQLSLHGWLVAALGLLFLVPMLVAFLAVHIQLLSDANTSPPLDIQQDVGAHPQRWHDATWQHALTNKLRGAGENILLLDAAGQTVYSTLAPAGGTTTKNQVILTEIGQVTVVKRGQQILGTAIIFLPNEGLSLDEVRRRIILEIALSFVPVLLLIAFWMRVAILKPLATMSEAARKIANNHLEIQLSHSPIAELAQVIEAFTTMSTALRDATYRQAQLEQERRLFIGAIAHDLRTPLFSLRGYLEAVQTGVARSPEQVAKYLTLSQKKAEALERLIGDLFAYTQLEYLAIVPQQDQIELGSLLQRMVESMHLKSSAKGIHLDAHGPTDPCWLVGDDYLLTRAVENLLDNALRYTPVDGTISVRWFADHERASFTITDTGPGIAPEALAHVFRPLYRAEPSRNRQTGGIGLGLTIVRRILLAHGGDITVANAPSRGTQFTGWLPMYGSHPRGSADTHAPQGELHAPDQAKPGHMESS
jgi:signal transduction histidine kinase